MPAAAGMWQPVQESRREGGADRFVPSEASLKGCGADHYGPRGGAGTIIFVVSSRSRVNVLMTACVVIFAVALGAQSQRRDVFVQSRNHPAIAYDTAPVDEFRTELARGRPGPT